MGPGLLFARPAGSMNTFSFLFFDVRLSWESTVPRIFSSFLANGGNRLNYFYSLPLCSRGPWWEAEGGKEEHVQICTPTFPAP